MEALPKLLKGTKLYMAESVDFGKQPIFDMLCTFYEQIDDSAFLISVPSRQGKPVAADETVKLLLRFEDGLQTLLVGGYVDDVEKRGIRMCWRIRRVEQHRIMKRASERLRISMPVQYAQNTWRSDSSRASEIRDGVSLDISLGGIAFYLNASVAVGDICYMYMPGFKEPIVAVACWRREAPKGSAYKYVSGLQLRFTGTEQQEEYSAYVGQLKEKYLL